VGNNEKATVGFTAANLPEYMDIDGTTYQVEWYWKVKVTQRHISKYERSD
jgi:hypothetical protein